MWSNSIKDHEMKWMTINLRLGVIGYWVKWRHNVETAERDYAIGKEGEKQPMGVFNGEDSAIAVVKLLIEGANEQKGT